LFESIPDGDLIFAAWSLFLFSFLCVFIAGFFYDCCGDCIAILVVT
jgi:hypothetical protein